MKLQYVEGAFTRQEVQRAGQKGLKVTGSDGAIIDLYSVLGHLEKMGIIEVHFPPLEGDKGMVIISSPYQKE